MQKKQELEAMSTEELCAFLERDLEQDSDPSQAMTAAEILAQREESAACDVDAAWKTFCETYRPFQSDAAPLLEEEVPKCDKPEKKEPVDTTAKPKRRRRWQPCMYSAAAAAVVAFAVLHSAPQGGLTPEDPNRELIGWNSRYITQWIPTPRTLTVGSATASDEEAELTVGNAEENTETAERNWSRSAVDYEQEQQEEMPPATFSTASAGETEQPLEDNAKPSGEEEDAGSAGTQGGAGGTVLPSDDSIFSDAIGTSDEENTTTDATAPQE